MDHRFLLLLAAPLVLAGAAPAASAADAAASHERPAVDSLAWPSASRVEARVRGLVAERLGVDGESVVLRWGVVDAPWIPGEGVPLRLEGTGSGGYWTVVFGDGIRRDPFAVLVRTGLRVRVPLAARRLERGTVLTAADIRWDGAVRWEGPGAAAHAVAAGWVARRLVREGEVLAPPAVDRPVLVRSGTEVEVEWARGNISLTFRARAMGSGAEGEIVRIRTGSGQRLQGVVVGSGRVRITVPEREAT